MALCRPLKFFYSNHGIVESLSKQGYCHVATCLCLLVQIKENGNARVCRSILNNVQLDLCQNFGTDPHVGVIVRGPGVHILLPINYMLQSESGKS